MFSCKSLLAVAIIVIVIPAVELSARGLTHFQDLRDSLFRADSCKDTTYYLSMNQYASFNNLKSGGFNTFAFAPNSGTDTNLTHDFGLAIGKKIPTCNCQSIRIEVEGAYRDFSGLITDSLQPEGPTALYNVDYDDRWSVMGNIWYDMPLKNMKTVYLGGGVGANGGKLSLNDGFVHGQGNFTELTWQIGGGITWNRNERWTVDLGYRFVDYGSAQVSLFNNFNNNPAGNFTGDLTSHQLMLGFRYNSLGDLFSRR